MHEVRLLVSTIFNLNLHGRFAPARTENLCPTAQNPRPPAGKICGIRAEDLRRTTQLSAGVRVEQPWNSSEKVKFSVSCYQSNKQVDKMKKLLFTKRTMDNDRQTIMFWNEQRGRLSMIGLRVYWQSIGFCQ